MSVASGGSRPDVRSVVNVGVDEEWVGRVVAEEDSVLHQVELLLQRHVPHTRIHVDVGSTNGAVVGPGNVLEIATLQRLQSL